MGPPRGLLPYAAAAAAVLIGSFVALGATLPAASRPSGPLPRPAASAATLSGAGRIAYWRAGPSGALELWVGDLDGPRRWTVARADPKAQVRITRWSPDGTAVAYVLGDGTLGIA